MQTKRPSFLLCDALFHGGLLQLLSVCDGTVHLCLSWEKVEVSKWNITSGKREVVLIKFPRVKLGFYKTKK